jgi:hypothetical protein
MIRESSGETAEKRTALSPLPSMELAQGNDQGELVASGVSVIQMAFFVTLLWSELTPTGCLIAPWIWIISGA